jgi:hypothetical protein
MGKLLPQAIVAAKEIGAWLRALNIVIPGRTSGSAQSAARRREPGIHNHHREYGFRACAKRRIPE